MAKKTKGQDSDLMKVTSEPHDLECALTQQERAVSAGQLAETLQRLEALDDNRKEAMADFNARKKTLTKELRSLTRHVKDGVAIRSVMCELKLNFTRLIAVLVRTDTGEVVYERPMTDDEKQMDMGFEDESTMKEQEEE